MKALLVLTLATLLVVLFGPSVAFGVSAMLLAVALLFLQRKIARTGAARFLRNVGAVFYCAADGYDHMQDRLRATAAHLDEMDCRRLAR